MVKKLIMILFMALLWPSLVLAENSTGQAKNINEELQSFVTENAVSSAVIQIYQAGKLQTFYLGQAKPTSQFEATAVEDILTGLVVAQQFDAAKLQLAAPLKRFFPKATDYFEKVTVRNLATNTSGLPVTATEEWLEKNQEISTDDTWQPSRFGRYLLVKILENVTHKNLAELYQNQIFSALGMKNTKLTSTGLVTSGPDMQRFLAAAIGLPPTPESILYPMRLTQTAFIEIPDRMLGLGWYINLHDQSQAQEVDNGVKEVPERPVFKPDNTYERMAANMYIAVLPSKKSGIIILLSKATDEKALMQFGRQLIGLTQNA